MLNLLGCADDRGVFDFRIEVIFLQKLATFLNQAFHSLALFGLGFFTQAGKDLFQSTNMITGLFQVFFKSFPQLWR